MRSLRLLAGCLVGLLLAALAVIVAPAASADPVALKINDEIYPTPVTAVGQVYFDQTFNVAYAGGPAVLSSTPDGLNGGVVDDVMDVVVTHPDGTSAAATYDYTEGCAWLAVRPPRDITALFVPGQNQLRIIYRDQCGGKYGAWTMYLVTNPPPPPAPKLIISTVSVDAPRSTDALLTRGLTITPDAADGAIDHFEYAWTSQSDAKAPQTALQSSSDVRGTLSFADTTPDANWYLMASAVDAAGTLGPWTKPLLVHTPKPPHLVFFGDSITSGHHQDYNDNGKTTCEDPNYGYAAAFAKTWLGALPAAWRISGQYVNSAVSGYTTSEVMLGGPDACNQPIRGVPFENALAVISSNTWNRFIGTAGVDDTNWESVIKTLLTLELAHEASLRSTGQPMPSSVCQGALDLLWNGFSASMQKTISLGVQNIAAAIHQLDAAANITWLGYYNMAGTGTNHLRLVPYLPATCDSAIESARTTLDTTIQNALPWYVSYVDTDSVMHGRNDRIQPLFLTSAVAKSLLDPVNPAGWPHPNDAGAAAIASLLSS